MTDAIINRYSKETKTANLGCAVLDPFLIIKDGDFIVDLGCGRGAFTSRVADIKPHSTTVVGIDLTAAMIEKANAENQRPNVKYIMSDITNLPFENDSVNIALSNCVINHVSDKEAVYKELYRVLKIDGYFLIGDIVSIGYLPEDVRNDPIAISQCYGGAIPEDDYIQAIRQAGFSDINILSRRRYEKNGFPIESLIIKGVKI